MSSFILWVSDDEHASETGISQLQQLPPASMNEFRRTLAKYLMQFLYQFSTEIIFCFIFSIFVFNISPGFHSFFIAYLWKLKSNSEEIDVQPSAVFQNYAQNPAVLKPTKCSSLRRSEMSIFSVFPIRIKSFYQGQLPKLRKNALCLSQSAFSYFPLYVRKCPTQGVLVQSPEPEAHN